MFARENNGCLLASSIVRGVYLRDLYLHVVVSCLGTNTKSLAKEFSKILIFEYFGYLNTGFNVFLILTLT